MGNITRRMLGIPQSTSQLPYPNDDEIYLNLICRWIRNGDTKIALRFIKKLHNIDRLSLECGLSALHSAAEHGDIRCMEALLKRSADVNVKDCRNFTPLHLTAGARLAHIKCTEVLIASGSHLDAQDVWGKTPLHRAIIYNNSKVAILLIKSGCSVNVTDDLDRPVLSLFANTSSSCTNALLNIVLEHGANIHKVDKKGRTPLYYAVLVGNLPLVEKLVDRGCDAKAQDLMCLAVSKCHMECAKFFLSRGMTVPEGLVETTLINLTKIPVSSKTDGHFSILRLLLCADGRCASVRMVLESLACVLTLMNQMDCMDSFPSLVPFVCVLLAVNNLSLDIVWQLLTVNSSLSKKVKAKLGYHQVPMLTAVCRTVIRETILQFRGNMYFVSNDLVMLPKVLQKYLLLEEY